MPFYQDNWDCVDEELVKVFMEIFKRGIIEPSMSEYA